MPTDLQLVEPITILLSDVDGVLTDGRIIYDNRGIEIKAFQVRDGLGIKLWRRAGHRFGIISSRNSQAVRIRSAELEVDALRQGVEDKWPAALETIRALGGTPETTCYIGDDLPDIPVMRRVGLAVAVADAADDVRRVAHWTTRLPGGKGAVRELIERMLRIKNQFQDYTQD